MAFTRNLSFSLTGSFVLILLVIAIIFTSKKPPDPVEPDRAFELLYEVVAREDVSYPGRDRMVFRVVLETSKIPSRKSVMDVATQIWSNGNTKWDDFTILAYLQGMDWQSFAYLIIKFTEYGFQEYEVNEAAITAMQWAE